MANHVPSYKSVVRRLNKEKKIKAEQARIISEINHYADYMVDLNNEDFIPFYYGAVWYKKNVESDHIYTLDIPDSTPTTTTTIAKRKNYYREAMYKDGWVSSYFEVNADSDFMTGYYLASVLIKNNNDDLLSFHAGCYNSSLINGMKARLATNQNSWTWYGADKKFNHAKLHHEKRRHTHNQRPRHNPDIMKNKLINEDDVLNELNSDNLTEVINNAQHHIDLNHILNGVKKDGDVFNLYTVKSICNQMSDIINKKLSFYICDIYPKDVRTLYIECMIALTQIHDTGFSVIRMPELQHWGSSTNLMNFLVFMGMQYHIVKLFKTPWGPTPRYYLIVSHARERMTSAKYTALISYITRVYNNKSTNIPNLYNKEFMKSEQIVNHLKYISEQKNKLLTTCIEKSCNDANNRWAELMGGSVDVIDDTANTSG